MPPFYRAPLPEQNNHRDRASAALRLLLLLVPGTLLLGQFTINTWRTELDARLAAMQLKPTQATADHSQIVAPGSVITLKKDGLGLWVLGARRPQTNTWVSGTIKPQFPALLARAAEEGTARIFAAGEKVWITRVLIEPKDAGVDLEFLSNEYSGVRFWGTLRFLPEKGAAPDGSGIASAIEDAIAVEMPVDPRAGLCPGLINITSKLPADTATTLFLPNASFPPKDSIQNDSSHHTETFTLPGDQAASVHGLIQACLPGFAVIDPPKVGENGWLSHLEKSEPPFSLDLGISSGYRGPSPRDPGYTFVAVVFHRAEDETQLRLDFATIAYVWTASSTCGWPVSIEQNRNFTRFGGLWFNQELGLAKRHIEQKGRLDFCGDAAERAKFDKLAPTLWPKGKVGAP